MLGVQPAHRRYYEACVGTWRCPMQMAVTDLAELRSSGMGWSERLSLRVMARWPVWFGRFWLHTSVRLEGNSEVIHTTTVRWLGLPVMTSTERIHLDDDGRTIHLAGRQRVAPALWRRRPVTGTGTVNDDATAASYEFDWLGVRLHQTTTREGDRVTLTQAGPGFAGVQPLDRTGAAIDVRVRRP